MKAKQFISRLLVLTLCIGLLSAVPAHAAETGGLNGDSGKWADFDESVYDEVIWISTIKDMNVNGYTWPASGTILLKQGSSTYTLTGSKPNCTGITIPGGLVVDIYKYYQSAGMSEPVYKLLGHFDTRDGNPYTIGSSNSNTASTTVAGFQDVRSTDYYAGAVKWAKEGGVTAGTNADGTAFSPAATVTRAEAMTLLWRAAGKPEPQSTASPFADVTDPGAYYYKAVLWAAEQGITNGIGGTDFGLNGTLAYDQILTFLCRAAGENADGSDWSDAAVAWAEQSGLTGGLSFTAKADCPRADVVYCLWKQLADGAAEDSAAQQQVPSGLSDLEGARAAIINGFLERRGQIQLSSYNVEASVVREMMLEIADKDGENPYNISTLACNEKDGRRALTIGVGYFMQSTEDTYKTNEEIRKLAEDVVKQVVTSGMSDYEKAKALHNWLVLNCEYDTRLYTGNLPDVSYTAYGPLEHGVSVCAGYAKAYMALLESAGLEAEYVTGKAGGRHAWNVVKIDGEWYHVDTTWDDPVPDKKGYVSYQYFLKSDAYMLANRHTSWTSDHTCTSTKYDNSQLVDNKQEAEMEIANDIAAFCLAAIERMPSWTEAELQAMDDDALQENRFLYLDVSDSGFDADDLSQFQRTVGELVVAQYQDLKFYKFDRTNMRYQFTRTDVTAEIQRRSDEAKAQQEAAKAQQAADTAAAKAAIQEVLRQVLPAMTSKDATAEVPGYSKSILQKACTQLRSETYSFDGYVYNTDYRVSASGDGVISITSYRWEDEETQRYVELIDAAIDKEKVRITLPNGDYPDKPNKPWYYASQAESRAAAEGHTTPGGLIVGEDYTLSGGITKEGYAVTITYLKHEALTEEEFIARIQEAIRNGETRIEFQYVSAEERAAFELAKSTLTSTGFDGYIPGTDYKITNYIYSSTIIRIDIAYPSGEQD